MDTLTPATSSTSGIDQESYERNRRRRMERIIRALLMGCAIISVVTTVGIVVLLLFESLKFFLYDGVSITEFLTGTVWAPQNDQFGILPLFCGTMLVTVGAAIVAMPLGLGTAIYLSEYASPIVRETVKPALEILAGIPSVVFGYLAIVVIAPYIHDLFPDADPANAAAAAIVVGFMILPTVISLSEDVLRAVPRSLREGAFALGATKYDVTVKVVVPAALSGIMASFLLAISRAIGETMAVTLAAGGTPRITLNPLRSIQTMTAYIVEKAQGENPYGTVEYRTIFAVGLTLFVSTMLLNLVAQWILGRMREKYE
ncbi:phosphate ABC transporter permease subunit PstC [Aeoliella mucimassa]|uniref:Phosphate transport system permease protein n=1 Tax=Aeoliella mucimassa TaxID=2527972 RepID=A0A518AJ41_9BACT|nr:phosphate ABC transporter permease subunit PstC [Aeoliella mucimassa]QDU54745.1 Phosphate transport system permease protein PstC [Aeoliella mucimassa]